MNTNHFAATVEGGLLRPEKPLGLADGTRVEIIVVPKSAGERSAADILATIAALPPQGNDRGPFTSRDHDKILYGDQGE